MPVALRSCFVLNFCTGWKTWGISSGRNLRAPPPSCRSVQQSDPGVHHMSDFLVHVYLQTANDGDAARESGAVEAEWYYRALTALAEGGAWDPCEISEARTYPAQTHRSRPGKEGSDGASEAIAR